MQAKPSLLLDRLCPLVCRGDVWRVFESNAVMEVVSELVDEHSDVPQDRLLWVDDNQGILLSPHQVPHSGPANPIRQ